MTEAVHTGSFDVGIADEAFSRYATQVGLTAAELEPENDFIAPLLRSIAARLALFPLVPAEAGRVRLHIGFVDHPEPNAFADWSQGAFFLVVHSGQLLSAVEAAIQMQDNLGAFAQRLDAESGPSDRPVLETPLGVTSFLNHLRGVQDGRDLFKDAKSPDDPATQRATTFIAACLQFTLMHEFGHVVNGHLGWLARHQLRHSLREVNFGYADMPPEERYVRRFFEHEADVFALEVLLRSAYQNSANENELIVIMLSFLTTVYGWSVLEVAPELGQGEDHPGAEYRMLALPMALMGLLTQMPEAEERFQSAIQRCRAIVSRVASKYPPFAVMLSIFSQEAVERADLIGGWMTEMDRVTGDRARDPIPRTTSA